MHIYGILCSYIKIRSNKHASNDIQVNKFLLVALPAHQGIQDAYKYMHLDIYIYIYIYIVKAYLNIYDFRGKTLVVHIKVIICQLE